MSYDRHRLLEKAYTIQWRGHEFMYSDPWGQHINNSQAVLRPDGPFPALTSQVSVVVGKQVMTLGRAEVDELVLLAQKASRAGMEIINNVTKTEGAA